MVNEKMKSWSHRMPLTWSTSRICAKSHSSLPTCTNTLRPSAFSTAQRSGQLQTSNTQSTGRLVLWKFQAWNRLCPHGHIHDHLVHPITLDGVLQILFPAIGNGATNLPEAMIPAFIGNLWIANEAALSTPSCKITGFAKTRFNGPREAQGRAVMLDTISKRPVIVLEGLKSKAVTSMHYAADGSSTVSFQERKLTGYEMQFKPDVDLLTADQKNQVDYDPLDERPTAISPKSSTTWSCSL